MTTNTKRRPASEGREKFVKLLIATKKAEVSRQEVKDIAKSNGIRTTVVSWFVRNPDNRATRGMYAVPADTKMAFVEDAPAKAVKASKPAKVKAPAKPAKAPKAPKQSKPVAKSSMKDDNIADVMKPAGVVDVLDAIDTDITDFEDREYAEGYVKGMV